MAKIEFPKQLKSLLEESNLSGPIRLLADRVGEILADNKLPFFPDYTDHVNCVLKSEVELVPRRRAQYPLPPMKGRSHLGGEGRW
jgi:hypothetical protein